MKRLAIVVLTTFYLLLPLVVLRQTWSMYRTMGEEVSLFTQGYVTNELVIVAASSIVLATWLIITIQVIHAMVTRSVNDLEGRKTLVGIVGSLIIGGFLGQSQTSHMSPGKAESLPVAPVAQAASATVLLLQVRQLRRIQERTLAMGTRPVPVEPNVSHPDELMRLVDRSVPLTLHREPLSQDPKVIVRVYGYPIIENSQGHLATFRKTRALELLVWLSLNRDRPRRSAARTAIWDIDVSDSSFATVVSDMRRGLASLCEGSSPHDWAPPSYGDEIQLSDQVVTDAQLLANSLVEFRRSPDDAVHDLVLRLEKIRDLPFSGTNYLWPDIDGTTTRLVMVGLTAIDEVVEWCMDNGKQSAAIAAIASGLRMVPGHGRLLDMQSAVINTSRRNHVARRRHLHQLVSKVAT